MMTSAKWWAFQSDQVFVVLAATAAVCFCVLVLWKVGVLVHSAARGRRLPPPQLGYVRLASTSADMSCVDLQCTSMESDKRHYRVLEAAQTI
ncbi:unnamed protein product [Ixodes persulcatus]